MACSLCSHSSQMLVHPESVVLMAYVIHSIKNYCMCGVYINMYVLC